MSFQTLSESLTALLHSVWRPKVKPVFVGSIVVAAELRYGASKRGSKKLTSMVAAALSAIEVLPLDIPADHQYGRLRSRLSAQGIMIGPNDMLIAAHALAEKLTLVTDNIKEFNRIEGLSVVNWRE